MNNPLKSLNKENAIKIRRTIMTYTCNNDKYKWPKTLLCFKNQDFQIGKQQNPNLALFQRNS